MPDIRDVPKELLDSTVANPAEAKAVHSSEGKTELPEYKVKFIERAIEAKALLFGEFTLKSGRISPYFFNAGLLYSGSLLSTIAHSYASSLLDSPIGPNFDVLFGPAYKGISLAAITAMALAEKHGVDRDFCYNRKEKKDHGEGGTMVGAELKGKVVVIDDVLTRGVAAREAIALLPPNTCSLAGIIILLDRQEIGNVPADADLTSPSARQSTVQEIEKEFGVPVVPIVGMRDIITWMENKGGMEEELSKMRAYREKWGAADS